MERRASEPGPRQATTRLELRYQASSHRSMMLELGYPLKLDVVEACGVYDAEADKEDVLRTCSKHRGRVMAHAERRGEGRGARRDEY